MTKTVRTVKPTDSVKKAVLTMNRYRIGSVIVIENYEPAGIITERDMLKRIVARGKNADKVKCGTIMSRPLRTIDTSDSIEDAAALMAKRKIKKLAVMKDGRLAGILTVTDILKSGERIELAALKKLAQFFPVRVPTTEAG